jgi:hypothetical protein
VWLGLRQIHKIKVKIDVEGKKKKRTGCVAGNLSTYRYSRSTFNEDVVHPALIVD